MSSDSPVAIVFGSDGYEVSVRDNAQLEDNINADGYVRALLIAGSDGYLTHHVKTDGYGRLLISGQAADGYSAVSSNPFVVAGKDDSNIVRTIKTLPNGVLENRYYELATFNAVATAITTAQNKSLLSVFNSSSRIVRLEEIYLINVRTTAVTGVSGFFELRRITGHSGGSVVSNIESYETSDVLDVGITVRTSAIVSGESVKLLWRSMFSTDDFGTQALDMDGIEHVFQTMFPVFVKRTNNSKTITLKQNEGLNIKFVTNTTTGLFDVFCVFTQE